LALSHIWIQLLLFFCFFISTAQKKAEKQKKKQIFQRITIQKSQLFLQFSFAFCSSAFANLTASKILKRETKQRSAMLSKAKLC
jgi:hypothetical protein